MESSSTHLCLWGCGLIPIHTRVCRQVVRAQGRLCSASGWRRGSACVVSPWVTSCVTSCSLTAAEGATCGTSWREERSCLRSVWLLSSLCIIYYCSQIIVLVHCMKWKDHGVLRLTKVNKNKIGVCQISTKVLHFTNFLYYTNICCFHPKMQVWKGKERRKPFPKTFREPLVTHFNQWIVTVLQTHSPIKIHSSRWSSHCVFTCAAWAWRQ